MSTPTIPPTMHQNLGKLSVGLKTGDITKQGDMDAVVNAANAEFMPGGSATVSYFKQTQPPPTSTGTSTK